MLAICSRPPATQRAGICRRQMNGLNKQRDGQPGASPADQCDASEVRWSWRTPAAAALVKPDAHRAEAHLRRRRKPGFARKCLGKGCLPFLLARGCRPRCGWPRSAIADLQKVELQLRNVPEALQRARLPAAELIASGELASSGQRQWEVSLCWPAAVACRCESLV